MNVFINFDQDYNSILYFFNFSKPKIPVELETDPAILQRRQKQIDYGKNTVGYVNYTQQIPL